MERKSRRFETADQEDFTRLLSLHFSPVGALPRCRILQLHRHYLLLTRWNRVLNLTSIRTLEDAVVRHYCESLFLGMRLPVRPLSVLDLGSGGGFPGIPMAVLRPDCSFTLSESHQRKAVFLREASRELPNVRLYAGRAERLAESFEWVVSRAVRWQVVLPIAHRLGRKVGLLVGDCDAARIIDSPGFRWDEPLPLPWGNRRLLLVGEVCST